MWWAPRRRTWWIGVLFALGSACFVVGPFPGFVHLVGAPADAAVFFAGSIAFTAAATLQYLEAEGEDRRAAAIQLAGTLLFNLSTGNALREALPDADSHRLVWAPDAFGSLCFLVASWLAFLPVRHTRDRGRPRTIAIVNLAGSVAFGVSAAASYVVPSTGDVLDLAAANFTTVVGAACFLAGALLLIAPDGTASPSPDSGTATRDQPPRGRHRRSSA